VFEGFSYSLSRQSVNRTLAQVQAFGRGIMLMVERVDPPDSLSGLGGMK
jgi:hypothetical protein